MSDNNEIIQLKQALATMYTNAEADIKKQATQYLENFQKSQLAWSIIHEILSNNQESIEIKLFASQTLRSKITYDLSQLGDNQESLINLKNSVIQLICKYNLSQDRLIRTQLCISLSQLSLQLIWWENAMDEILSNLSSNETLIPCLLEFLKILPEELNDVKKTSLTDDEFNIRTQQLITDKVETIIVLLTNLTESNNISLNSLILDCLNSWIKECPIEQILTVTSLTNLIFNSLSNDDTFDKSIECLCTIMRETRDIENYELIDALYKKILELHSFMIESGKFPNDIEISTQLTRLYVEAGESWHVLIAKNPQHFKPLVEILLSCVKNDEDLDVVKYTFYFWYLLKQLITLPKFESNKLQFKDIYTQLIEIIIGHLTYPINNEQDGENKENNDDNLFDGDKEQEDKFKEFRYEMGDVLKDCCAVVGATTALSIPFKQIESFINENKSQWQLLEAPLFSMRAMAKEVPTREKQMLPIIMKYLIQLPEHAKVRYSATLVLGRYTEWTAKNPEFLEPQLNYIIKGFQGNEIGGDVNDSNSKDIVIAASHALMYFCQDCSDLLINYLEQLYLLYGQVQNKLDIDSTFKLVDGLAHVLVKLPRENLYETTQMFLKPTLDEWNNLIENGSNEDENIITLLGDKIEIISIFIGILKCKNFEESNYPIADLFINEIWKFIPIILNKFGKSLKISERVLKLIKNSVQSFSTYLNPILGEIVNLLHDGFKTTLFGCYLWVSGVIIREFGDEYLNEEIKLEIFKFGISQSYSFFEILNNFNNLNKFEQIPDVIEDFFRMINDLLMFFPFKLIPDVNILKLITDASLITLTKIEEIDPLISVLHFLIDLISWGFEYPPISFFEDNPIEIQMTIQNFLMIDNNGGELMRVLINGVIFKFHNDIQQDANDLILKIMTVIPNKLLSIQWLNDVVKNLPNVNDKEVDKLIKVVEVALPNKDNRRIRSGLKDFINWYIRKNVNTRLE